MLKIYDYIQIKYPHKIDKCNFISKVLNHVVFDALIALVVVFVLLFICVVVFDKSELLEWVCEYIIKYILWVISAILACGSKLYLLIMPFVVAFQCFDSVKNKTCNNRIAINVAAWILIAIATLYFSDLRRREDACMAECVNEDGSNYNQCLFSTCDFII